MSNEDIPRIYVACLAAYNNGELHGEWIDCNQDADSINAAIQEMLQCSPEPDAEEWAIHDTENWQGIKLREYESIERVAALAEMLVEHGKAFAAYCQYYGSDATPDDFRDRYVGQYESEEDFAESLWDDQGRLQQLEALAINSSYIDWEAVACDLFLSSYHAVELGYQDVYVFTV